MMILGKRSLVKHFASSSKLALSLVLHILLLFLLQNWKLGRLLRLRSIYGLTWRYHLCLSCWDSRNWPSQLMIILRGLFPTCMANILDDIREDFVLVLCHSYSLVALTGIYNSYQCCSVHIRWPLLALGRVTYFCGLAISSSSSRAILSLTLMLWLLVRCISLLSFGTLLHRSLRVMKAY